MKVLIRLYVLFFTVLFMNCQGGIAQNYMEYIFPQRVNEAIDEKIFSYEEHPGWSFYLIISRVSHGEGASNYQLFLESYKGDLPGVVAGLIEKTNRYYQSKNTRIPIIFDYDYVFTSFGTDRHGRVIRKNMTGSGYLIEFDKNGEIVRTGN